MEEKKTEELEEKEGAEKKMEGEKKLPFCTTAPSSEHARASNEDEPCDDGREGDTNTPEPD